MKEPLTNKLIDKKLMNLYGVGVVFSLQYSPNLYRKNGCDFFFDKMMRRGKTKRLINTRSNWHFNAFNLFQLS